jgi:hypothetical protein
MHDSINSLQNLMIDGGAQLFDIAPLAIKNIIEERQWVGRKDQNGKQFESFEEFVKHIRWQGLGSSIEELLTFCRKHPDVQRLLRMEMGELGDPQGGAPIGNQNAAKNNIDNVNVVSRTKQVKGGDDPTYIMKRLKRDRPDLAIKVMDGELSAHAAGIEAGFIKPDLPLEKIRKLLPKLTHDEIIELMQDLPKAMKLLDKGSKPATTVSTKGNGKANRGNSRTYIVTAPDGTEQIVTNLKQFGLAHGLNSNHLPSKGSKGWKARRAPAALDS